MPGEGGAGWSGVRVKMYPRRRRLAKQIKWNCGNAGNDYKIARYFCGDISSLDSKTSGKHAQKERFKSRGGKFYKTISFAVLTEFNWILFHKIPQALYAICMQKLELLMVLAWGFLCRHWLNSFTDLRLRSQAQTGGLPNSAGLDVQPPNGRVRRLLHN